ncbi:MAG: hypothetical protein A3H70_05490 [Candidatus Komeilibacteria bacterium RIFCSPLOWO2_02_FULL_48_11]|uniref:DUF2178 domain-containing protein n=1 Tax=Candidatus Komeilibacteria bacterium RIFCSPLOWO2_02_FULL_48_11 TaxID=1798553 RepID=A0A1G2BV80_9BACT|nr:MAG: hypothetical protein A3H70_05490 [Candidatus Komeilibacteria bacterium RIFCSPLOWO2_02_FULL_48_11]
MKKDKLRLIGMSILACLVLLTSLLYGIEMAKRGRINFGGSLALIILLIAILFMIYFIKHKYSDVRKGLPLDDERSKKVMTQAAAMTFYISLYWLLAISFFESFFAKMFGVIKLDAGQVVGGGIAGMSIIFIIAWIYYQSKGRLL